MACGHLSRERMVAGMKIAILGPNWPGSLASSLASGARALGHDAQAVGAAQLTGGWGPLVVGRRHGFEALVGLPLVNLLESRLLALEPDLVLVVKGRFITRHHVERLRRRLGCPIINYYPDHPTASAFRDARLLQALGAYDEVIVWAEHVAEGLADYGISAVRIVPFGYDPDLYRPAALRPNPQWDAVLIGQCYPTRLEHTLGLADLRLFISGRGWRRATVGTGLAAVIRDDVFQGTDICEYYWRSCAALNILHDVNKPAHNMRSFEIPASGTAMIATRTRGHEALFGTDGAVLVDTPSETREAVQFLARNPGYRDQVARRGLERITGHTYECRMRTILSRWAPVPNTDC